MGRLPAVGRTAVLERGDFASSAKKKQRERGKGFGMKQQRNERGADLCVYLPMVKPSVNKA